MTNITKKPHFVPAAYLQYWDVGKKPNGRDSLIYWCNGEICTKQKVNKVAVQSGLYSKTDPNTAEEYLSEFESDWSKLVNQLITGKPPKNEILGALLLLQSSYFLLRNPKFSNISTEDRIDVYKKAIEGYWREILMAGTVPGEKEDALIKLGKMWSCHLLPAQEEPWITSDNPTLLLSYKGESPGIIYLPINPDWALFAIRNSVVSLKRTKITEQDTKYLNSYTTINSIRHIYSCDSFDKNEMISVSKWLSRRPETDNWIDEEEMHFEPFIYPVHGMTLSFL